MLKWALAILDDWTSLQQEIATVRNTSGPLAGRLSIGVIPSGLPMVALMTKAIQLRHPGIELSVGLVALDRDPISPLVLAAFECAKAVEPPAMSKPSPAAARV